MYKQCFQTCIQRCIPNAINTVRKHCKTQGNLCIGCPQKRPPMKREHSKKFRFCKSRSTTLGPSCLRPYKISTFATFVLQPTMYQAPCTKYRVPSTMCQESRMAQADRCKDVLRRCYAQRAQSGAAPLVCCAPCQDRVPCVFSTISHRFSGLRALDLSERSVRIALPVEDL